MELTEESLNLLRTTCLKKPGNRTTSELEPLISLTKNTKVFQELIEISGLNIHAKCCQHLYYEFVAEGNYVFKIGEFGDKFYIIAQGIVGIEIKVSASMEEVPEFREVTQLKDGQWFGELALENNAPRGASVLCKTDCHFFYLLKHDYQRILSGFLYQKKQKLIKFCRNLPAFSRVSVSTIQKLTYNFKSIKTSKNQIVYKENDISDQIFIVQEGEFTLYKTIRVNKLTGAKSQRQINTKRHVLIISKGEVFGDYECFHERKRKFSCICTSSQGSILGISSNELALRINNEAKLEEMKARSLEKYQEMKARAKVWLTIQEDRGKILTPRSKFKQSSIMDTASRAEIKPPANLLPKIKRPMQSHRKINTQVFKRSSKFVDRIKKEVSQRSLSKFKFTPAKRSSLEQMCRVDTISVVSMNSYAQYNCIWKPMNQ